MERDSRHADAYFLMAEEYFTLDVVAAYEKAIVLSSEDRAYSRRLANACFRISRAEEVYQKALQWVDSKRGELHNRLCAAGAGQI